jgi:hypothetical protein
MPLAPAMAARRDDSEVPTGEVVAKWRAKAYGCGTRYLGVMTHIVLARVTDRDAPWQNAGKTSSSNWRRITRGRMWL